MLGEVKIKPGVRLLQTRTTTKITANAQNASPRVLMKCLHNLGTSRSGHKVSKIDSGGFRKIKPDSASAVVIGIFCRQCPHRRKIVFTSPIEHWSCSLNHLWFLQMLEEVPLNCMMFAVLRHIAFLKSIICFHTRCCNLFCHLLTSFWRRI